MLHRLGRLGLSLLRATWYLLLLLAVLGLWNNDAPPFVYVAF